MDQRQYLEELLTAMAQQGASDLHLSPGHYPILRIDGRLLMLSSKKILDAETLEGLVSTLLGEERKVKFLAEKEIDFSYELANRNRFRVNVYQTRGGFATSLRLIPNEVKSIDELSLPPIIKIFSSLSQGLVLIASPSGHGKSTTLAALVDLINKERSEKIITIEDPVEYIFTPDKSIIDQREVGRDSLSFHSAIKSTFRQNANVIVVGEMRDHQALGEAIAAAESGQLVLASINTNCASQTVERIINSFPPNQEVQIRNQLANCIAGIVSQRLVPRIRSGLIPAVEVMIVTPAIKTLIRDNRPRQIDLVIETSQNMGMISLDRYLSDLVGRKEISLDKAEFYSMNPSDFRKLMP